VQAALRQDYQSFYQAELEMRRALNYPPFCRLVKLIIQDKELAKAKGKAEEIKQAFGRRFGRSQVQQLAGPVPAVPAELRGVHRQCLLLKTKDLPTLRAFLREHKIFLLEGVSIDIDPIMTN